MWNTGLRTLRNRTGSTIYFIALDRPSFAYSIADGANLSGNGLPFPWCLNSLEVRTYGFRIHRGPNTNAPVMFYLFQCYTDDTVYYMPPPASSSTQRQWAGEGPSSYLDIDIGSDERPIASAVSFFLAPSVEEDGGTEAEIQVEGRRRFLSPQERDPDPGESGR
jgi:hypothetical protein